MRYFIKLAYNGKNYHGWQMQDNASSVQETLVFVFSKLLHEEIEITGCGRTDTGVHASLFYAHFDSEKFDIEHKSDFIQKANSFLQADIVIFDIFPVIADAHARFDALSRTYQYHLAMEKNPFKSEFTYRCHVNLDVELMNKALPILFEYQDFSCFSKSETQTKTNNCRIMLARWERKDDELIFTIQADRFLRNMVRAIVGTWLELGKHRIGLDDIHHIIQSKNRSKAGTSVPAQALFLVDVDYDFDKLRVL